MEQRVINGITYYLEYKGVKNINMRLLSDGSIKISAPYGTSKSRIDEIVLSHLSWYKKAYNHKMNQKEVTNTKGYIVVWGKVYDLIINQGTKRFYLENEKAFVYYPNFDSLSIQRYIDKQLIKILSDKVNEIRDFCDSIIYDYHLNLPSEFKYRVMSTRWGSCQIQSRVITLNTKLVHYPEECLKYVLLHEYMHLIVPNHSTRFHELMDYYMPNNKEVRNLLNTFQIDYN